jgi:hypothetical protein
MTKLIDTSVWLEFLRPGGAATRRDAVARLMGANEAAYCGPVELELMAGARTPRDMEYVRLALEDCIRFPVEEEFWRMAGEAQHLLCRKGKRVGLGDLLIAAVARAHRVPVVTRDTDFVRIHTLVWPDLNVETLE